MPQLAQATPLEPQLVSAGERQLVPEQHPFGHEVASHTQLPATHRWPAPQDAPAPHAHIPASVHLSAVRWSQATHTIPAEPHRASSGVTQTPASQQPLGHDAASHPQCPPVHFWPAAHATPEPHAQAPAAEHPSARSLSHPTQAAAPRPQAARVGTLQVAPEQQPSGQVAAVQLLHLPAVQPSVAGQTSHALPPAPHELVVSPDKQAPPEQHPLGQEVPSHTQELPMHRWPRAQVAPVPQRQIPVAEQLSARLSHTAQVEPPLPQVSRERTAHTVPSQQPPGHELASQIHWAPAQRCPPAQEGPLPQRHRPPGPQRSARTGSQVKQVTPLMPQLVGPGALHTSPAQHPAGHDSASH